MFLSLIIRHNYKLYFSCINKRKFKMIIVTLTSLREIYFIQTYLLHCYCRLMLLCSRVYKRIVNIWLHLSKTYNSKPPLARIINGNVALPLCTVFLYIRAEAPSLYVLPSPFIGNNLPCFKTLLKCLLLML